MPNGFGPYRNPPALPSYWDMPNWTGTGGGAAAEPWDYGGIQEARSQGWVDGWGRRRRRRGINPLNVRAARRAIRRIAGVLKITRRIQSKLPKRHCTRTHARRFGRR